MYRATASAYYVHEPAGNMLIYNDTFRLTDSLQDYINSLSSRPTQSAKRLRLDADIKSLMAFGKRSYAKEMESQRTILRDLLDGAQGFSSVSTEPFASAADSAVHVTVDRIQDVAREWTPILSRSALLQSLGGLVSSVLNKLILDIEDLSDISEDESKALKRFCDVFDSLKDLFVQEQEGPDGEMVQANMTGVYAPVWFKFQYLAEILESSLADIKFLWTESELKLEFEAEEVVDLIRALFAESEHRRRAIAEIRRTAPNQS
jgi:protein transport protein DSL1/ZW10